MEKSNKALPFVEVLHLKNEPVTISHKEKGTWEGTALPVQSFMDMNSLPLQGGMYLDLDDYGKTWLAYRGRIAEELTTETPSRERSKEVWDTNLQRYIEMPAEMQAFMVDLEAVCRKHNLVVGLNKFDELAVQRLSEKSLSLLLGANKDYLQED